MSEPGGDERLKALDERIAKAKAASAPKPRTEDHYSQANIAWRMVTELVAGLGIGFGIGYGIDAALGTKPVFMVLFIGLGFAAGVRVMLRTAAEIGGNAGSKAEGSAGNEGD